MIKAILGSLRNKQTLLSPQKSWVYEPSILYSYKSYKETIGGALESVCLRRELLTEFSHKNISIILIRKGQSRNN